MKTEIKQITPKWAAEVLEENSKRITAGSFRQRNIRDRLVRKYADDMIAGEWRLTHQGIAFDEAGNLVDGQHRLMAVVKAQATVPMLVSTGLTTTEALSVVDCGATRNVAQQLQVVHGYSSAASFAAIMRNLVQFVQDDPKLGSCQGYAFTSTPTTLWLLEDLNFKHSVERLMVCVPITRQRAYWSAPWCLYHKASPRKAEDFARQLFSLEGLDAGHPVLMLHRYITNISERPRRDRTHVMRIAANALQIFDAGGKVTGSSLRPSRESHSWLLRLDKGKLAEQIQKRVVG